MRADSSRILLLCHVSAAATAVGAAARLWGVAPREIDVLTYGRVSEETPLPDGARLIRLAVGEGTPLLEGLRLVRTLRRRRYRVVALSQPDLGSSRARGPLLAATAVSGGRRAVILDPRHGEVVRRINGRLVAADATRWCLWAVLARSLAKFTAHLVEAAPLRVQGARPLADAGSVVYLRTDVELRSAPLLAGGSAAHTEGVLSALRARGYGVELWSTGDIAGIPAEIRRARLRVLLRANVPTEIGELVSGLRQGLFPPRGRRADAFVYQRYSLNNLAGVLLARRWRVPLVLEANASEAKWREEFSVLRFRRLGYACERFILRNADIVATVSDNARADLLAAGAILERVRVVPNGVNVARFTDAEPVNLPASFGDAFVVCFVGLFYPWHGVKFLAEAFVLLRRQHPHARLLLVGDGEELPVVRGVLERGDALRDALLTGMVPRFEAPRYLAAADALVSPHANVDRFIGSPIKLFEYMASGRPIVATRVGQIPHILKDGETAILVEPDDPHAMAAALSRLLADRELGSRLGRAAQAEARARHSWDARMSMLVNGGGHAAERR